MIKDHNNTKIVLFNYPGQEESQIGEDVIFYFIYYFKLIYTNLYNASIIDKLLLKL